MVNDSPLLPRSDGFVHRHLGPRSADLPSMLQVLGVESLSGLIDRAIPEPIRWRGELAVPAARGEAQVLDDLRELAEQNQLARSYLGLGYHGCITPPVVLRNILENPGWYTQYTPYQAEISQGAVGSAVELPDDGARSDRHGGRQLVAARRGDRGGRGHDAMCARARLSKSKSERTRFLHRPTPVIRKLSKSCPQSRAEQHLNIKCVSRRPRLPLPDRIHGFLACCCSIRLLHRAIVDYDYRELVKKVHEMKGDGHGSRGFAQP